MGQSHSDMVELICQALDACREQEGVEQWPRTLFQLTYIDGPEPPQLVKVDHFGKVPAFSFASPFFSESSTVQCVG